MKTIAGIETDKGRKEYAIQEGIFIGNTLVETIGMFYAIKGYKKVEKLQPQNPQQPQTSYGACPDSRDYPDKTLLSRL